MTLVDTSVWIDWQRRGDRAPTRLLEQLIESRDLALPAVVLQELLQGARGPQQLAIIREYFGDWPILTPSAATYAEAGALYARCRWAGTTPRSSVDCLIAATALEVDAMLLHDDVDFVRMAQVEPKLKLVAV